VKADVDENFEELREIIEKRCICMQSICVCETSPFVFVVLVFLSYVISAGFYI
jgi:hypothetical protein